MVDDQVVAARWRVAVKGLVDLAVGGVDADPGRLDQDRPAAVNLANMWMRPVD